MKSLFSVTILILSIITFLSCKKSQVNPNNSIIGKWRWVKSIGGIAGATLTPQNTSNNFREEFYSDSSFRYYMNDSLIFQKSFSIIKNYKYTATQTVDVLKIEPVSRSFLLRNDTLYTEDLFISDGFSDIYVRIR